MAEMREIYTLDGTTVMVPAPKFKAGDIVIYKDKVYSIPKKTNSFQGNPLHSFRYGNTWIYMLNPIDEREKDVRVLEKGLTLAYRKD